MQIESISSSCAYDFDQDLLSKLHDIKEQLCEPHDTTVDIVYSSHSLISSKIPNRYRSLHLPPTLHDYPTKHHKFLPKFDGESKNLTAEKQLQSFEHFLDLFEVEHDDVCMRAFFPLLERRC